MKVKALRVFADSKENKIHRIGEEFEVTQERYEEVLAADEKDPFITLIDGNSKEPPEGYDGLNDGGSSSSEYPKHTGGGWYELSNGEKVQGKEEALKAEQELAGVS